MKPETINLLCHPISHTALKLVTIDLPGMIVEKLVSRYPRQEYRIVNSVPDFLNVDEQPVKNNQGFYDLIAPVYDFLHAVPNLRKGGEGKMRGTILQPLDIRAGDKVLEVSVGTGANLRVLPCDAEYFGVDISRAMLAQCQKSQKNNGFNVELFLADAMYLPFKDCSFDKVFNMLSLRLISDKEKAIKEVLRVAKPGATILIADRIDSPMPAFLAEHKAKMEEFPEWNIFRIVLKKS